MTYSNNLHRDIDIPIDRLNQADLAELEAAISALPGYPDCWPPQVRAAAASGDINAQFVLRRAEEGDPLACEWAFD